MVETTSRRRRKPLILSSTKNLINSLLTSSSFSHFHDSSSKFHLPVGILRFNNHSSLLALSTSLLIRLSITSGSLVLVKNTEMNIQRIAVVVALDPPGTTPEPPCDNVKLPSSRSSRIMLVLPSCDFPHSDPLLLDHEVVYLSPLLAFNLNLHISCLKSILQNGQDYLATYFKPEGADEDTAKSIKDYDINVELEPLAQPPRFASHLRVSFVKIPESGILESIRGTSPVELEERQDMIDMALQKYFEVNRYLSGGDVFGININWNCNSTICIPCNQNSQKKNNNLVYFKVIAMEPSDEPILCVNRTSTALVLGGSSPSALPPDLLIAGQEGHVPLQGDTVKILASILTPTYCPSALSSKFRVSVLLYGLAGCGKRTVVRYVAHRLGLHVVEYNCHDLMASDKTSVALAQAFKTARRYSPTILLLRHFDVFRDSNSPEGSLNDQRGNTSEVASVIRKFTEPVSEHGDSNSQWKSNSEFVERNPEKTSGHQILLIAAADSSEGLPSTIRRCFSHEISMGTLTEEQRAEMLFQSLQSVSELLSDTDGFVKEMVGQTSGYMPRDMSALIADAGANLFPRSNAEVDKGRLQDVDDDCLGSEVTEDKNQKVSSQIAGKEDLMKALEQSKKRNATALGAPKVPNVKWEDVGGLEDVKKSILDTVQLPLLHKDLFSSGLRKRSGVLLYGPPGTGKTLLAKAVATECSLNFLSVKGPELINMYIGESEKNVRDIFQKARSARPCVIFFDELDSLAPARGASGDSGGVMDRVVSQMLAEIDGLSDSSQDLFIIGASNRPDLIDPALLRPGRFDKLLYVGVNSDPSYRERVLKALTRKFKLHDDVSLYSIAKKCPPNFTGADMYALCADAWFHAAKRKVLSEDPESSNQDNEADSVVVEYNDFVQVLVELSPSLSMTELKKYEQLRDQFEGTSK
ncbi:putative ATPase, AAA-type, core, P-loop containing nucleoside triphosphate hydrolase [Lupinus albus]|uniref:Peroxisomal ATPase PEX6 n=1 Tax=Lupinus albus TaxID=3870 RepID=A0A6A4NJK0_LUPAL|nr:putative ATPase, AAA-type, core, P-loop containing nucleoside triphosphate hydrolase [Lupinus albus]